MYLEINNIYQKEACDILVHRMSKPDRVKLIVQTTTEPLLLEVEDRIRLVLSVDQAREMAYQLSKKVGER